MVTDRFRLLLISPKGPLYRHRGGIFRKSLRYAPLTLSTLASLVPPDMQADIRIVDEGIEDVDPEADADLVGMTVITGTAPRAYELAARFRERHIPVVLGGPHVTLVPDDAQPHADSVVVGYAEETWPELLRDVAAGRLKPRYVQRPDLKLENLPFPRRDLMQRRHYLTTHVFEATRGCIHDCDFCVVPAAWGRKPYQKPVADVIADIRQSGARRLIFVDLNLIADKPYARSLFEALIPLRVGWYGLATTLLVHDRELLDLAARSGCRGLLMGFESIVPENVKSSNKTFNLLHEYRFVVDALHRHGITLQGCFVFGLDHDTPDIFERTARFAIEASIDLPRFAIVTPFPGTALYRRLEQEGRILTRNWELYDGQHVVFRPAGLTMEALQHGHEAAWKLAYGASGMARRLFGSRLQLPVSIAANLGYRFYAHHLRSFYNCDWVLPRETAAV